MQWHAMRVPYREFVLLVILPREAACCVCCSYRGVFVCLIDLYYGEKERVGIEIRIEDRDIIIPSYKTHATHFVLLTH